MIVLEYRRGNILVHFMNPYCLQKKIQLAEYAQVMRAQTNGDPAPQVGMEDVIGCLAHLMGDDAPGAEDAPAEDKGPRLLSPGQ